MFSCMFSSGVFYANLYKFNFETIVLEKTESGQNNYYKINIPDFIDINNYKYSFQDKNHLLKTSLINGNQEEIPRNSPEGCILSNIYNKNYINYTPFNNKFDFYLETAN
jgi:hypothetical protein